jgi:hypothetical protein
VTLFPERLWEVAVGRRSLTGLQFLLGSTVVGFAAALLVMLASYALFIPDELRRQVAQRGGWIALDMSIALLVLAAAEFIYFTVAALASSLLAGAFRYDRKIALTVDQWFHLSSLDPLFYACLSLGFAPRAYAQAHRLDADFLAMQVQDFEIVVSIIIVAMYCRTIYYWLKTVRGFGPREFWLAYAPPIVIGGMVRAAALSLFFMFVYDAG